MWSVHVKSINLIVHFFVKALYFYRSKFKATTYKWLFALFDFSSCCPTPNSLFSEVLQLSIPEAMHASYGLYWVILHYLE